MIVTFCLMTLYPITSFAIPSIQLVLDDSSIQVGETFHLDVFAGAVTTDDGLLAFGFDVSSVGGIANYTGYEIGPAFFDDSPLFFPETMVAGSAFPSIFGDDILLARLSFQAISPGDGYLGIFSDLSVFSEGLFTESTQFDLTIQLQVTVNNGTTPVPEPTTAILVGLGLAGVLILRRRSSFLG
jgi:hypothetical protein